MPFGHLRSSLEQGSLGLGPRSIEQVGQVNQVGNYLERPSSHTQKPQGGPEAVPSPSSKKVGLTHLPSEPAAPKERARTEANVVPSGVTLNTACNSSEAVFSFKPCGQFTIGFVDDMEQCMWKCLGDWHGRCRAPDTFSNLPAIFRACWGRGPGVPASSQNSVPRMKFPRGLPVSVLLWSVSRWQLDKKWLKAGNSMFL